VGEHGLSPTFSSPVSVTIFNEEENDEDEEFNEEEEWEDDDTDMWDEA